MSVVDEDLNGVVTSVHGNIVVFKAEYGFTHQYPKEKLVPKVSDFYETVEVVKKAEPKKIFQRNIWYTLLYIHTRKVDLRRSVCNRVIAETFSNSFVERFWCGENAQCNYCCRCCVALFERN